MDMFHFMESEGMVLSVCLAPGGEQTAEMREVIEECPGLKVAVGHFGMVTAPGWEEQVKLALSDNVMIESGGITWLFNSEFEAIDMVGEDKLMWGSDYPRTITAITYKMSYDFVCKTDALTDRQKQLFLGENARGFYGFGHLPELPYVKNMSE